MTRITLCFLLISAEQVLLFTAHKSIHSNRGMRDSETEMVNEMNKAEDGKSCNKDERNLSIQSSLLGINLCTANRTESNRTCQTKEKSKAVSLCNNLIPQSKL